MHSSSLWDGQSNRLQKTVAPAIFNKGRLCAELGRCVPRPPVKELDEEGKEKAIKSLLAEFASTYDRSEATTCVQELGEGGACHTALGVGAGFAGCLHDRELMHRTLDAYTGSRHYAPLSVSADSQLQQIPTPVLRQSMELH